MSDKQVFQTDTPGRWIRFKWLSRVIIIVLAFSVVAAAITVTSKHYPSLPNLNPAPKKLTKEELDQLKKLKKFKDFKLDKGEIQKLAHSRHLHQLKRPNNKDRINAAFYRPWEAQAYSSLADNYPKLDMVVSEGFSIVPKRDTLVANIDTGLINLNKKYKKPVLISLSNYVNENNAKGGYDSKDVERIIKNKTLRVAFINNIARQLAHFKFQGVNLDFDEIKDRNSKNYIAFENDLYAILHAAGFLVTQNVIPDDEQFNLERLQHINDFLFVMAIDQHNESSNAGDLSNQHWVEKILDDVCTKIPSEKVILTVAGGAIDWPATSIGTAMGYPQAISIAQEKGSKITFDPVSANLHYKYFDDDSLEHTVYFTDAATNFNIIRMADDWATGGVALWRMGSEDPRLWTFFPKNLSIDSLKKTGIDVKRLTSVGLNNKINYDGNGEVLDLITTPTPGQIDVRMD
ncbi:MAG: glycosyl hydrolase family 18 protein, partial [Mucilaginibacter sp.]